jgi:hypothetical protein
MSQPNEVKYVGGGMGVLGWLTILFIGLKLTGYITWPWWWVLAPMWIPVSILLFFFILYFAFVTTHGKNPRL